jgi:type IV pilus assembly protein PilO
MALKTSFNFSAIGDQFKGLNTKDPSGWPIYPKIAMTLAAIVLVFVAGYFMDWSTQFEQLEEGRQTEETLKQEYTKKYAQAVNLELYKKQLVEVNQLLGTMLRQLPNRSQMETLITDINNAGLSRNLQFELFKPASQENKNEIYAELPIAIRVVGKYHEMGGFVADIGQLSRIVTINDINIRPQNEGSATGALVMEANAKTFRYLDDQEIAEARSKSKPAKPKAAPAPEPAKSGH